MIKLQIIFFNMFINSVYPNIETIIMHDENNLEISGINAINEVSSYEVVKENLSAE